MAKPSIGTSRDIFTFENPQDAVQTLNLAYLGAPVEASFSEFLTEYADLEAPGAIDSLSRVYTNNPSFSMSDAGDGGADLVRSVFFNLFDRNTDNQEVTFWTESLENGTNDAADLPRAILASARESDIEAWQAKLFIADYFTAESAAGDWVPDALTTQSLHSNEELWFELMQLDMASEDMSLAQVGTSLGGRPLYAATVGTGEASALFITQQHGDEPIGTEAALTFLDFLTGDSDEAAAIREGATITIVPRVNPDGFERWEQEAGGVQGLTDPRVNDAGQDLNRTYDPENPFSVDVAPEAVAVKELIASVDPDFVFDYHGQGNYRDEDGDLDTMSVLWPTNPVVSEDVRDASKRAVVTIDSSLDEFDFSQLTLYPGSDNPAIARNGFSLAGTPGVLVEQRYSQEMFEITQGLDLDYSALRSALALEGFISMKGLASAIADGSIDSVDPELALNIPERSDRISYDDLYSDDHYPADDLLLA